MLENTQTRIAYRIGDASAQYPFSFPFIDPDSIHCFIASPDGLSVRQLRNSEFSLHTQPGSPGGGVTLNPQVATAGHTLTIQRILPLVQQTALPNGGRFPSLAVERQFDRLVMMIQQLYDLYKRCVSIDAATDNQNVQMVLSGAIRAELAAESLEFNASAIQSMYDALIHQDDDSISYVIVDNSGGGGGTGDGGGGTDNPPVITPIDGDIAWANLDNSSDLGSTTVYLNLDDSSDSGNVSASEISSSGGSGGDSGGDSGGGSGGDPATPSDPVAGVLYEYDGAVANVTAYESDGVTVNATLLYVA